MIAALLLAAGHSRRFGAPKLLAEVNGKALVRWSAEAVVHPLIHEVVVVVGPDHAGIASALTGLSLRLVVNPEPAFGMGHSLACGIAALPPATEAVLVALADAPVRATVVEGVIARYRAGGVGIVVPTFHGVRGHPVLFDRMVFPELAALTGDVGARDLTTRDSERVAFVEQHIDVRVDVDRPADLALLRDQLAGDTAGDTH